MTGSGRDRPVGHADGVITGLVAKRGRADRVTVYLGGKVAFDLAALVADQASLHVGDALAAEQQERLVQADAPYRAREKALGLLATRERARREIELRLQRCGFEPNIVSDTVGWLKSLGYLDDRRFAECYAAEKLARGWGDRRVAAELLRKGVERHVVDEALEACAGTDDEAGDGLEAVTALACKRFGRQFAVDPETATRRLVGFMARRGYDWEAIRAVSRSLTVEAGSEETDYAGGDGE